MLLFWILFLLISKIIKMGYVPSKYMGYACSIVSSYNREMEKKAKTDAKAEERFLRLIGK